MVPNGIQATGHRIPTAPMQQGEVKVHLFNRERKDEAAAVAHLTSKIEDYSVSREIYKERGLDRTVIKDCREAMARDSRHYKGIQR